MIDYKVFEDAPDYIKKDNGAILSRNITGLQEYKNKKMEKTKLDNALTEINRLNSEIEKIKSILGIT